MKRGIQIVVLFSVLFGLSNCKKTETDILYSKKYLNEIKQIRQEIGYFMAGNFVPGASVAIWKDGEFIYSEGIGLASKDLNVRATRSTKFRIGRISELYTTLIYFKLVEEGVLHPDSTIQHYYPDFPAKEYPLTLEQLVQHTSGIREPNLREETGQGFYISLQKGIDKFKDDPLICPPGLYQYPSSYNFNLLGAIMEKATNKRFHEIFKSYLTDTLHLNHTLLDNPFLSIEDRSNFFDQNMISQVVNSTTIDLRHRAPSEGILSNAEDLVNLTREFIAGNYISEDTRQKVFTKIHLVDNYVPDMTNSWMVMTDNRGNLIYGKDGSVTGGSASVLVYPDENLIIACATNLTKASADFPIFKLAEPFLSKDGKKEEEAKK